MKKTSKVNSGPVGPVRPVMILLAATTVIATACARGNGSSTSASTSQTVTQAEVPIGCSTQPNTQPLPERVSPFDSTRIQIGGRVAQVCYSRPSAKGRMIFDSLVAYDKLWRTGANEPTIIHITFPAEIAGVRVEPGSYSIYTIPTKTDWTVIVNRAVKQWGHESLYVPAIQAQEVGRGKVPSEHPATFTETFSIHSEAHGTDTADLVLDWERTRVRIPIHAVAGS